MNTFTARSFICFAALVSLVMAMPSRARAHAEQSYEDKQHHFRLTYPDSLTQADPPKKTTFLFLTPKELKPDAKMRASVQVKTESSRAMPGVSLEQAATGFSKSMEKHGITIKSMTDATIGGRPARRIEYAHTIKIGDADVKVKAVVYIFIVDDWTWSIDARAPEIEFDMFAPIGEAVAKSFEFTKAS